MKKFNPSNEEIVLIEQLIRKVILINLESGLDVDICITKKGVHLFVNSKQGCASWNDSPWGVTDQDFRSMFRWLCEQKEKAFEKTI